MEADQSVELVSLRPTRFNSERSQRSGKGKKMMQRKISQVGAASGIARVGYSCDVAGSSNGRTPDSGSGYEGSTPSPAVLKGRQPTAKLEDFESSHLRSNRSAPVLPWPSGKAKVCKTFIPGSNPGGSLEKAMTKLNITHSGFLQCCSGPLVYR